MKIYRNLAIFCFLFVPAILVTSFIFGQDTKKKIKDDVCPLLPIPLASVPQRNTLWIHRLSMLHRYQGVAVEILCHCRPRAFQTPSQTKHSV